MAHAPGGRSRGPSRRLGSVFASWGFSAESRGARRRATRRLAVERLEPLLMLHADLGHDLDAHAHSEDLYIDAVGVQAAAGEGGGEGGGGGTFSNLPVLNSLAGAAQSLYLDFDGHFDAVWGSFTNITTPAFDKDGDPTTLSSNEVSTIEEIWARIAEDYAPFKINVTTVDPGDFSNGKALRVAIGGDGSWIGPYGGVAYVNAFTNSIVNTAYVFSKNLGNGTAKYVAEASSHEAGHAFGLQHQSSYNSSGQKTAEYNPGNSNWAPIMGSSYNAARSIWYNGRTTSYTTFQDDMAVISRTANIFGYRADDVADNTLNATAVTVNGSSISASGIISKMTDVDYFKFSTGGGSVAITLNVASVGANLDSVLELRNQAGQVMATANPATSLSASISTTLVAGNYYLVARSTGEYGSVGQYSITGTVPPMTGGGGGGGEGGGGGGGGSTPSFTISDVSITEGNSGNRLAYFNVRLSAPSSSVVTVQYATANGTASSSTDFFSTSGTLTFTAGQTLKQVAVYVRGDTTVEANETFYVDLRNPSGATIADSRGVCTIVNDDAAASGGFYWRGAAPQLAASEAGGASAPSGNGAADAGGGRSAASFDRLFALLGRGEAAAGTLANAKDGGAVAAALPEVGRAALAERHELRAALGDRADDSYISAFDASACRSGSAARNALPAAFDWLADLSFSANPLSKLA